MSQERNIHWYPGHMQKAIRELEKKVKVVDLVIEVIDARAVESSLNPLLSQLVQNKNHLLLVNKCDLSDKEVYQKQIKKLQQDYPYVLDSSMLDRKQIQKIKEMIHLIHEAKKQKQIAKGMKPQPIRVMIIGIPNVGKSTLINRLAGRKVARVENRPGLTRSEQWIKVNPEFDLLDSPGILDKKYENDLTKYALALINAIPLGILQHDEIAHYLINYLRREYPETLASYLGFAVKTDDDSYQLFAQLLSKKGFLSSNKEDDLNRTYRAFIQDFQNGLIGKISLEKHLC